jgi:hypothetical protein
MSMRLMAAGIAAAAGAVAAAVWMRLIPRATPETRERQRRLRLNGRGRLADGMLTSASGNTLYFNYEVSGVAYSTSQDVSALRDSLPDEPERLVGPVTVKYARENPADSIVVCENWSGLRAKARKA